MSPQPAVLVTLRPALYQELFTTDADARLRKLVSLTFNTQERNWSSDELAAHITRFDAVITGWGTPKFTDAVLSASLQLKLIAHSAGSIKAMLPPAVFDRDIAVTHAASAIAPAVAELTLMLIMLCLRPVQKLDHMLKGGAWSQAKNTSMGQEIAGQRVGVVGTGYTGRCVIRLLRAVGAEVWAYDPYLTDECATELGVRKVDLNTLLAECPIITLQAPPTKETYHMIGAPQLALLQDGAVFINTARAHLVDQDAMLAELQTGRFVAALDVFDPEPLPDDSPFRKLDNVILTPHIAGASKQARIRQGNIIVDEIERFFTGEALQYRVTRDMLDIMA
ncbi:MAG TPA: hydroxyacid dehydrogenase [Spirillospora sp.]|nr:hydroxyacid dehydrogenase [Spirillospora sp.]